jgi:formate hydrogenlyase transcriptional activator
MANARRSPNLPIQAFPTSPSSAQTLPSEAVLDALKMMLIGASLNEVLTSITRLIEAHSEGMLCSIFLLDEDGLHLRYGVAANLPQAYRAATDGVCIGPNVGSCGAAAYLRQPVFISDMLSHPNWEGFRDVVLQSGLRAAWSTPILSHDGKVLGTFCMYYREVRQPVTDEIQLIDYASRIAAIAIERKRAEEKLRQDERELRQLIDFLPQHVLVLDKGGKLLQANKTMLDYNGYTLEEMQGAGTQERIARDLHPDDLERVKSERSAGFSRGAPFDIEKRMLSKDGRYRWFLFRYNPVLNEHGHIVRWFATATDIEDRKHAEERMRNETVALREDIVRSSMFEEIVGSSQALRKILEEVSMVAPTDSTVLILGETGTGKELIARAIHKRSDRAGHAFIPVNCAAIPPSLIASELFGHEKGSFTGAIQQRMGRFEAADGGTIFLDEVGDLPAETQLALLRVLQEREIERVGSVKPIRIDVRILAATNCDLEEAVADHRFRQDLFYRLNIFPIRIPSLRERADDIPLLVEYFVERYAKKAGKKIRSISKKTLDLFQSYNWPGNIRELQNVVERAVILCDDEIFSVDETWLKRDNRQPSGPAVALATTLEQREREAIETALADARGQVGGPKGAAAKLGIPRQTLESKIKSLGINKFRFKTP